MNDFQMNHLASQRRHDFQREAASARLAREVTKASNRRSLRGLRANGPRSTIRLTLAHVFGGGQS